MSLATSLSVNDRAWALADQMDDQASLLRVAVHRLSNGTRVIDAGIEVEGGYEAGRLLGEICMGGLGQVACGSLALGDRSFPGVVVRTDHPAVACMASQYAGWAIQLERYFAMGSGPLRAQARVERELYAKLGYAEQASRGVLVLETRQLPTAAVAEYVAAKAGLPPDKLTFVVAPTASLAGGIQIAARILETGLHKMETLGFDVNRVVSGIGWAPIPPPAKNDTRAIGRTNDCILYGGQAHFLVRADEAELAALAPKIPSSSSRDYGTPFYEIFERYDRDFYRIDPLLFSPAAVWLTSVGSGRTYQAGAINLEVLARSLYPEA